MRLNIFHDLLALSTICIPVAAMAETPTPTSEQSDRLGTMIDAAPAMGGAMQEARDLIVRAITTSACAKSPTAFNDLNDVMVNPRHWGNLFNSEGYVGEFFHRAGRPGCLDVVWVRPRRISTHEIAVNVRYAAGQDRRYVHQSFFFRKMPDSRWRISAIDVVFEYGL